MGVADRWCLVREVGRCWDLEQGHGDQGGTLFVIGPRTFLLDLAACVTAPDLPLPLSTSYRGPSFARALGRAQ